MEYMKNKNILFYGPANTSDKVNLDIHNYDIIIITNNMISIFFDKFKDIKSKIILLSNELYTRKYLNTIELYDKYIYSYITKSLKSKKLLERFNKPIIVSRNNNYTPLGLTIVLNIVSNINFKSLYITGVTFYNTSFNNFYEKNYIVKETINNNIFKNSPHKPYIDYLYTKNFCKKKKRIYLS